MKRSEALCWDLFPGEEGVALLLWKQSGEIIHSFVLRGRLEWSTIISISNVKDASLALLNENFFAVMYTESDHDGGVLELVSIPYRIVTNRAALKTTVHSGRGLWFVNGRLFMVGGGRVTTCRVSGLHSGLDAFIGKSADRQQLLGSREERSAVYLYGCLPNLFREGATDQIVEVLCEAVDLPEQLLMDAVLYFLKLSIEEEKRLSLLKPLLTREFSDILIADEISRLDMSQVLKIIEIICCLLEESCEDQRSEARLLDWISLLYNSHYVQLILSKDEKSLSILEPLAARIEELQQTKDALSHTRNLVYSMRATHVTLEPTLTLGYCIELLQI